MKPAASRCTTPPAARRRPPHDAARTAFGADVALVLMEMLPPTGWGSVVTREQLEAVEQRFETRFDHGSIGCGRQSASVSGACSSG